MNFNEMAGTLKDVIDSNVYVVSRKGKLLGYAIKEEIENNRMKQMLEERQFPKSTRAIYSISKKQHRILISTVNILRSLLKTKTYSAKG